MTHSIGSVNVSGSGEYHHTHSDVALDATCLPAGETDSYRLLNGGKLRE